MRFIQVVFIFISIIALSGCNQYRLAESELNQEVEKRIQEQPNQRISVAVGDQLINLSMLVKAANVDLSSADGGVANIMMDSEMTGSVMVFGQPMSLATQLGTAIQAGVKIDQGAIYLVNPKLVDIEINGASFNDQMVRSILGSLHHDFEVALAGYFAANPVYILEHSPLEKSVAMMVKDIEIQDDAMIISMF